MTGERDGEVVKLLVQRLGQARLRGQGWWDWSYGWGRREWEGRDEPGGHLGRITMGLVGLWISYKGQWGLLEGLPSGGSGVEESYLTIWETWV